MYNSEENTSDQEYNTNEDERGWCQQYCSDDTTNICDKLIMI